MSNLEHDRHVRFVHGFAWYALAMACVMGSVNLLEGRPTLAVAAGLGGLAPFSVAWLSRSGYHRPAVWGAVVSTWFAASGAVVAAGGLAGTATTFLAIVPVYATLSGGIRPGLFAALACFGSALAISFVDLPLPASDETSRILVSRLLATALLGGMGIALVDSTDGLTATLQRTRRRTTESLRTKDRLLASCSHDLRTPLTAVLGYTDLLLDEAREADDADLVSDLRHVRKAAERLLATIDDVLALARLQSGRFEVRREPTDLAELLRSVDADAKIAPELRTRPATVDRRRLARALIALKGLGGATVSARTVRSGAPDEPPGDWLAVEVEAPRLPVEGSPSDVFRPFELLGTTRAPESARTGLELAIVELEIAVLGGAVAWVDDAGAARFELRIPLDDAGSTPRLHPPARAPAPDEPPS